MQITVNHVVDQDEWQSQFGPMRGWYFMGTDANGNEGLFQINTKPTHTLQPGTTFDFEPNGQTVERGGYTYAKGKRANKPGPNPYGGGQQRPATPAAPAAGSPAQRPAKRLTEAEALATMQRLNAALGVAAEASQATTVFLGILRGEIEPAAPRLPLPQPKPMPPGYQPQEQQGEEQDIPF